MRLLNRRHYQKKTPFRDAILYIIVCEGEKREPQYFEYFNGLSSQLKLYIIPSHHGESAPNHLLSNSTEATEKLVTDSGDYELWIILDLDCWQSHLPSLHNEVRQNSSWNLAISNPCFEIWLYYHFNDVLPPEQEYNSCKRVKGLTNMQVQGGFDSNKHPGLVSTAITNSQKNYSENGYIPDFGGTQIFRIMEKIYPLTKSVIENN